MPSWAFGCNCICIWKHSSGSPRRLLIGCVRRSKPAQRTRPTKGAISAVNRNKVLCAEWATKVKRFQNTCIYLRQYKNSSQCFWRCHSVRNENFAWHRLFEHNTSDDHYIFTLEAEKICNGKSKRELLIKRTSQSERKFNHIMMRISDRGRAALMQINYRPWRKLLEQLRGDRWAESAQQLQFFTLKIGRRNDKNKCARDHFFCVQKRSFDQ